MADGTTGRGASQRSHHRIAGMLRNPHSHAQPPAIGSAIHADRREGRRTEGPLVYKSALEARAPELFAILIGYLTLVVTQGRRERRRTWMDVISETPVASSVAGIINSLLADIASRYRSFRLALLPTLGSLRERPAP